MNTSFTASTKLTAAVFLASALSLAAATGAQAADTVNVGLSTSLSGSIASLGQTNKNGIELAVADINAAGGLLGSQIKLVTADDALKPATGVNNVRNFILNDKVKAVFGPVSSAVGAAEAQVVAQYKVPIFFSVSNDVDQTGKYFSDYVFQVVPSTHMEPAAVATYVAKRAKDKGWKTFYTISPNYNYGHTTVKDFLATLEEHGVKPEVLGQQWPELGASDYTSYVSAAASKDPDFLFIVQYGGDLITLTKQAAGQGLFNKSQVYAGYWSDVLQALGADAPAGAITSDRARPFYLAETDEMKAFNKAYHDKYKEWPSTWAILGYAAVQTWAEGVRKAESFDGEKVSQALSGAEIKSIHSTFRIRSCDHLAEIPEYVGVLSDDLDPTYGIRVMTDVFEAPASETMLSCEEKEAMRQKS